MHHLAFLIVAAAQAAAPVDTATRVVSVSAQSEIWVVPDQAVIRFSIASRERQVPEAKEANDQSARAIAKVVEAHALTGEEFKVAGLRLQPAYDDDHQVIGYYVIRSMEVRLSDFGKVDPFIAAVVDAGGDQLQIDSLRFQVRNQRKHQVEARRLAVEYAREKAEHLAALNGMRLGRVVRIREGVEYDDDAGGFGGFGGGALGAGLETGSGDAVAFSETPDRTAPDGFRFVGTQADDAIPIPKPSGGEGSVEKRLLASPGQVNLNAEVSVEFELLPGEAPR